jgi:hypothetical protein
MLLLMAFRDIFILTIANKVDINKIRDYLSCPQNCC